MPRRGLGAGASALAPIIALGRTIVKVETAFMPMDDEPSVSDRRRRNAVMRRFSVVRAIARAVLEGCAPRGTCRRALLSSGKRTVTASAVGCFYNAQALWHRSR